jgi:GNAT superfamily N-acetyltransferase
MINISPIAAEVLPRVQQIAQQTWPDTFGKILSPNQIAYMLKLIYSLEELERQMENGVTFLLATEGEIELGFAGFELNYAGAPKAKLHKLYLLPSAQGKGLGKKLLLDVADRARKAGQKSLLLNVNKYNHPAIDFYLRMGFDEIYKEVIDIGSGYVMDDLVMELML